MSTENNGTQSEGQSQSAESVEAKASLTEADSSSASSQDDNEAEPNGTADSEESGELEAEEKPKKKTGIQRLKDRHERELAKIRQELQDLKAQDRNGQREQAKAQDATEPKEEDFDSHKDYVKALAKYTYAQEKAEDEKKSKEAQAKQSHADQMKAYEARLTDFKKSNPKFDEAIEDYLEEHGDLQLSAGTHSSILESDVGPQILLELVNDPEELDRINSLSVMGAAREIGKIEARIAARSEKKETKTTTKAPAPLSPVGSKTSPRKSVLDEGISFAEYERLRRDSMRKKA